jgi:glutaminyl-peptide cyclotransferase
LKPNPDQRVTIRYEQTPFDGRRAYADLERVVGYGPRPPGSDALERLRGFIKSELRGAGLTVVEHRFEAATPLGPVKMVNVYGVVEGSDPGVIILSNHYDTKRFETFEFVGANDGGSTTAWMMEMARALGPERLGRSIWLMFFDGEEALVRWTEDDSLYGSRAFVRHLREEGQLEQIDALINVDMIGDCYLGVFNDSQAPAWLRDTIWRHAAALGYGSHFLSLGNPDILDDHVPFRNAGVVAINLIDFSYGGSTVEHRANWHTEEDTLDKVCWESLQAVGDVVYDALPAIDEGLDQKGRNRL